MNLEFYHEIISISCSASWRNSFSDINTLHQFSSGWYSPPLSFLFPLFSMCAYASGVSFENCVLLDFVYYCKLTISFILCGKFKSLIVIVINKFILISAVILSSLSPAFSLLSDFSFSDSLKLYLHVCIHMYCFPFIQHFPPTGSEFKHFTYAF